VYIGARNIQKAQDAIHEMRSISPVIPDGNLLPLGMEMGNLPEVKKVAERIVASESRLDILVNNAAL
jgi:NAD(P)-dependent dehydrogenase (short-subunit alcohol dehydrogenase family)